MNGQYVNESKTIRVPWSYDRGLIMTGFFTPFLLQYAAT